MIKAIAHPVAQHVTVKVFVAALREAVVFEKAFALFLEKASDVLRFAKLPERFNFVIPCTDSVANLRYYEPDFGRDDR